jgi:hypothetical protein
MRKHSSTPNALGEGVYVTRHMAKATNYGAVVLVLEVRPGNTYRVSGQDDKHRLDWHDHNFDSAWAPGKAILELARLLTQCAWFTANAIGEREEDCVWDPTRITVVRRATKDEYDEARRSLNDKGNTPKLGSWRKVS